MRMNKIFILLIVTLLAFLNNAQAQTKSKTKNNKIEMKELTKEEEQVIVYKGTEMPYSGKYNDFYKDGTYVCKRCQVPLYHSEDKFNSHCGWPAFDDEIKGAITRVPDADGRRTEIICTNCGAHLGHVFLGEGFTETNTRHCVNSISMDFVPAKKEAKAIFAGGCFWGVESLMERQKGVIDVISGYTGGTTENPNYAEVSHDNTGHVEAVEVTYDPTKVDYETLAKLFFEIHDPTQLNRQGPDIGEQYRSEIFYNNPQEKAIAEKLIKILKSKGYDVKTKVTKASKFYPAEDYHQDYYEKKGTKPYCHIYTKRF